MIQKIVIPEDTHSIMSLIICCVFVTLDGPCTFVYDLFYSYSYVVIGCHSILEYMAGLHTAVSLVTSTNRYYGLIEVYKSVIKFGPQENYGLIYSTHTWLEM